MDNNDTFQLDYIWTELTVLGHAKNLFYNGNNIWNLLETDYATGWDS